MREREERRSTGPADAAGEREEGGDLRDRAMMRRHAQRRAAGRAIDDGARAPLERSFGRSFGEVRVHEDGVAEARGAQAVTQGKDIHFARGKLAPETPGGRGLLAHELTHVVQQDGAASAAPQAKAPGAPPLSEASLEAEADQIGARAAAGHSVAGAIHGRAPAEAPQHFEEKEHKFIGDAGAGEFRDGVELVPGFQVSYGDIVALAGDWFGTLDQLQNLARVPGDKGQKPGTRDEVEYALVIGVQGQDSREKEFSKEVKHACSQRFYALATKNLQHFDNPRAADRKRDQADKDLDRDAGHGVSAGSTYRENHDNAIRIAAQNGKSGESINDAVVNEAFGHHFLTDSFSAGHVRTPRGDAKDYWNAKVPMFLYNFKHYMAQEVARHYPMVDVATALTTTDLRMQNKSLGSLQKIEKAFAETGVPDDFGFGEIVSGALHDYDNLHGVTATVDGQVTQLAGDNMLMSRDEKGNLRDPNGPGTRDLAVKAVQTSLDDVRKAYELGKQGLDLGAVSAALVDAKGMYAAERMIPQAVADDDPAQKTKSIEWKFDSIESLVADGGMRAALGVVAANKAHLFEGIAKSFDADAQKAFNEGVTNPLKNQPIDFLTSVINYTPNTGGGVLGHATAGEAADYLHAAHDTPGGLASLSLQQKEKLAADAKGMPVIQVLLAKIEDAPQVLEHVGWRTIWNKLGDGNERGQFLSMFAEEWWHTHDYETRKHELKNLAAFDEINATSLRSIQLIFRSSSDEEQQRLFSDVLEYDQRAQWLKQLQAIGIHVRRA